MIVYQYPDPDYGWITHTDIETLMDAIRADIEDQHDNGVVPCQMEITVRMAEMTQEEIDALPEP